MAQQNSQLVVQERTGSLNAALIFLIFFSSSFDIVLNFKIAGFSFRFSYLTIFFFIFVNAYKLFSGKFYLRYIGFIPFFIWSLFLLFFLPNTTLLYRNIGYFLWHLVHFLFVIFFCNVIDNRSKFLNVFKLYIYSFYLLAILGIVQFVMGVFQIDFFIQQWWFSRFPRVNGFTYEPSYYATYMIIGWTILFILLIKKISLFSDKKTRWMFLVATLAILLSTSRMGILFMVLETALFLLSIFAKAVFRLRLKKRFVFPVIAVSLLMILGVVVVIPIILTKYDFLLQGTGIAGQSRHSATRFDGMYELWEVFLSRPFSGTSLGGIPSALADYRGEVIRNLDEAKAFEGINIFLEILVASGAIGFAFFTLYVIKLFGKSIQLMKRLSTEEPYAAEILRSLILALFAELLILCFSQNILRLYLWVHIALVNAMFFTYIKKPDPITHEP